ncbi:hypothetical protein CONPUDRAFT_146078 [Coniophora puteana RWD-64-598 SS2]|uniref:Uncharacterized protein n=1 Tax=Coniophora puteana (strain RWD-64-598) TaxID=741705 RepID=A0A5M3MG44_CONPW|nr:uncharacterized protein CONPUDRAFT_146078 [Coniophora puteana RWD-64-598 SS2]EIW78017.1 hypothetical protein CONPUDRAFT_146078 [Coniophora puteana RWD-64-598 SS2]
MSPQPDHVDHLFSRPSVYETLFSMLSPRESIQVSRSCQAAHDAYLNFTHRAYDINRHLFYFFSDPVAFRSLQARTGTLISGSDALQFLERTVYPGSNLNIYTHPGHTLEVLDWLVNAEGYRYAPFPRRPRNYRDDVKPWDPQQSSMRWNTWVRDNGTGENGLGKIYPFTKVSGYGGERLRVQVMEAHMSPFIAITSFYSTCTMNIIAFDCAYSLYPVQTFEDRETLVTSKEIDKSHIDKYTRRGWSVVRVPFCPADARYKTSRWQPAAFRTPLDSRTWRVRLDMTGVETRPSLNPPPLSTSLPWDPVVANSWELNTLDACQKGAALPDHSDCTQPAMTCHHSQLHSGFFRYTYAVADAALPMFIDQYGNDDIRRNPQAWLDAEFPRYVQKALGELFRMSGGDTFPAISEQMAYLSNLLPNRQASSSSMQQPISVSTPSPAPLSRPSQITPDSRTSNAPSLKHNLAQALPRLRGMFE